MTSAKVKLLSLQTGLVECQREHSLVDLSCEAKENTEIDRQHCNIVILSPQHPFECVSVKLNGNHFHYS